MESQHRRAQPDAPAHDSAGAASSIEESLRSLGSAGKQGLGASVDALRALRRLFTADLALARVALARALVWLTVTVAFGSAAWLMLMGACIALLHHLGWSWLASLSFSALISLLIALAAAWQVRRYFEMSRLNATRRQLARLGIGGDDEDDQAEPGSGGNA